MLGFARVARKKIYGAVLGRGKSDYLMRAVAARWKGEAELVRPTSVIACTAIQISWIAVQLTYPATA